MQKKSSGDGAPKLQISVPCRGRTCLELPQNKKWYVIIFSPNHGNGISLLLSLSLSQTRMQYRKQRIRTCFKEETFSVQSRTTCLSLSPGEWLVVDATMTNCPCLCCCNCFEFFGRLSYPPQEAWARGRHGAVRWKVASEVRHGCQKDSLSADPSNNYL